MLSSAIRSAGLSVEHSWVVTLTSIRKLVLLREVLIIKLHRLERGFLNGPYYERVRKARNILENFKIHSWSNEFVQEFHFARIA